VYAGISFPVILLSISGTARCKDAAWHRLPVQPAVFCSARSFFKKHDAGSDEFYDVNSDEVLASVTTP